MQKNKAEMTIAEKKGVEPGSSGTAVGCVTYRPQNQLIASIVVKLISYYAWTLNQTWPNLLAITFQ